MYIRVGYDIAFEFPTATPIILLLEIRPDDGVTFLKAEQFEVEPKTPLERFVDPFGNRSIRLVAPAGVLRVRNDAVVEDSGLPDAVALEARQVPVNELPLEVLPFLLGSRYCELEKLSDIAWSLFGNRPEGWPRVQAVCDWVHQRIQFGYHFARADRTAFESYQEQQGVCRDFMHLSIALCRCLNIPARYVTGYLGDIGVPPVPFPMDFSAWFEVFLEDRWHTFDARHNQRRIGRIPIARGRDATDVAILTSFGRHTLQNFQIWTDEISVGQLKDIIAPVEERLMAEG